MCKAVLCDKSGRQLSASLELAYSSSHSPVVIEVKRKAVMLYLCMVMVV